MKMGQRHFENNFTKEDEKYKVLAMRNSVVVGRDLLKSTIHRVPATIGKSSTR